MDSEYIQNMKEPISTHTEQSAEDRSAVSYLESVLSPDGRINTCFSSDDKWPNDDGMFEYVSNPDISRRPEQKFIVQIKGTHVYTDKNGIISYNLKSLAFPAYIASEVTADPGVLFLILNPDIRGKKRIFWKYLSPAVLKTINFEQSSTTIKFYPEDEIKDTDASINLFCKKLDKIIEEHLFLRKLDDVFLTEEDALRIIKFRCEEISGDIDYFSMGEGSRDDISRKIVNCLYDLCYAILILNAVKLGYTNINEKLAWEVSQFKPETKYLNNFLKGLKYIGRRVPEEGQAERFMLKYNNYLWEIRQFLRKNFGMEVISNLEKFPLNMDTLDEDFYKKIAVCICNTDLRPTNVRESRYYIQNIVPFFVEGERYFEITLQLAGLYSTKYNRVTVYSKKYISTRYSIQIAYTEAKIDLREINSKIKILNNRKVSFDPVCLNKFAKMLMMNIKINRTYGEYISLMKFLTQTEMDLLQVINLGNERFQKVYDYIYGSTNTRYFGKVLLEVQENFSKNSNKLGRYTIRYALLNLREETIEDILPNKYNSKHLDGLNITSKCYPFEKKPFISNIAGAKSSKNSMDDIIEVVDDIQKYALVLPYLKIEKLIGETGELYFDKNLIGTDEQIKKYNAGLDYWEQRNGFKINEENDIVSIDSYESTTIFILQRLLKSSHGYNRETEKNNKNYIKDCGRAFEDKIKREAIKNLFVYSQIMLIYGAAGTGKTTLISYISEMLNKSKKLYLAKTHTALNNLQNKISNAIENVQFASIDSITKSNESIDYDVIFIDECSIIDNRTMKKFLEKVSDETRLIFSGDIYQIESIEFGHWFYYAKDIIGIKGASVELLHNWRTKKRELSSLRDEVREKRPIITEKLSIDGPFSKNLGKEIFELDDDEVVLCLNYDGKFGLNNVNQYFQNANKKSKEFTWAEWIFKIGDRIIFLDTRRSELLYNNLKGTIIDINKTDSSIIFTIDIKTHLTEEQCKYESFEYIKNINDDTRINLEVIAWNDELTDEDRIRTVIPFQIAYAISIHKAQGMEYKSVKVVIPSSNAERITHSIFYTAITRAKEKLMIYWSAETMDAIIKSFTDQNIQHRTLDIIKDKLKI